MATILSKKYEYIGLLESMNLKEEFFDIVSFSIIQAINSVTTNDVRSRKGLEAWMMSNRKLRDILKPHGWEKYNFGGIEGVTNREITIIPSSGDKNTGNSVLNPKSRNPKGEQSRDVLENRHYKLMQMSDIKPIQLNLFNESFNSTKENDSKWVFLYFYDEDKNELRRELSLPLIVGKNFDEWDKRIIFEPYSLKKDKANKTQEEYTPDAEFKIRKK